MTPVPTSRSVVVVGAGVIGLLAAWRLALAGQVVTLVDPSLAPPRAGRQPGPAQEAAAAGAPFSLTGSQAALGVLMARVFQRSSGRAWRLRQRSHQLWHQWLADLERRGHHLARRPGLLLLAADSRELELQGRIAADRRRLAIPMELRAPGQLAGLRPALPEPLLGGLLSPEDGQLDPAPLLAALHQEALAAGVCCLAEAAEAVERGGRWRLRLAGGASLQADCLVLCLGLATADLLAGLGHVLPLEPVLGQALELELAAPPDWNWPGVVVWRGLNLVPRPDLDPAGRRLWLGATLEPGMTASPDALAALRELGGEAPPWLQLATVRRHWQGWRCRPVGQPAPVLAEPEPGLLVATAHYRNGLLLAPATADWLCARIAPRPGDAPAA